MRIDLEHFPPPSGFYYSTKEYCAQETLNNKKTTYYSEFTFDHSSIRSMPKSIHSSIPWEFKRAYYNIPPKEFVAEIPRGRIVEGCHLVTENNKILWDVSIHYGPYLTVEPNNHPLLQMKHLPPMKETTDKAAALTFCASQYYYHWMFDILPRIRLLSLKGIKVDKYIINRNGPKQPFQDETLHKLGINSDKIIEADKKFHMRASNLVVSSLSGYKGQMPKWTCDFLRESFLDNDEIVENDSGSKLIYITRQNARHRKVINDLKIQEFLKEIGFKIIKLETLSVKEQARLFNNAKVIVGAHGGGFTNLVFCQPNTKVIELFSPTWVAPLYWILSNHLDLDYYFLIGEGERPPDYVDVPGCFNDIEIKMKKLKKTLKLAGVY
ncbi:glycosyltransferase family 61 protein [Thalassorhabdus alkalitolerans]|uniref:Glycosyltransferase family 61 protein n=1 Tax=Thalassorhabdus alkalitolerans TaxID=2282697 RepID=A0ABW0YNS4_9BACI